MPSRLLTIAIALFCICLPVLSLQAQEGPDSVGPFRWVRRLLPADGQSIPSEALSRDGTSERATFTPGAGGIRDRIDLYQWTGTNMAGTRSFSGNTLIGGAGKNYFVYVRKWAIEQGIEASGSWLYSKLNQQAAHVRLAFTSAASDELNPVHGSGFSLDNALPYNSIVCNLTFGHKIGSGDYWQTTFHKGNPVQCGVWQVPSGLSLTRAQAVVDSNGNPIHRLAVFDVFSEFSPTSPFGVKLQAGPLGAWEILFDIDGDGAADVSRKSSDAGSSRSALTGVSDEGGLLVGACVNGGVATPNVGRFKVSLEVEQRSQADYADYNRRPFSIAYNAFSSVSPAEVTGVKWGPSYSISGTRGAEPLVIGYNTETNFYTFVPLSATGESDFRIQQSGTPPTTRDGVITWTPTDLYGAHHISVRAGDSLLLTYNGNCGPGEVIQIDVDGDGTVDFSGASGDRFPFQFREAGEFVAKVYQGDDLASTAKVNVTSVVFPKVVACHIGYERDVMVQVAPAYVNAIKFESQDPTVLAVRIKGTGLITVLGVKPLKRGTPIITARLPSGTVIATREVDEFTLSNTASIGGIVNDTTSKTSGTIVMKPYIADVWMNFSMFASTSSFKNGASSFKVNTSQGASTIGEPGFSKVADPEVGISGVFKYTVEVPPAENKSCMSVTPSQINSPEQVIGPQANANGAWCRVKVEKTVLKEGEKKDIPIYVIKATSSHGGHQIGTTAGSTGDSPLPISGNQVLNCSVAGPHQTAVADCSNFKVGPGYTASPVYPGKYTIWIDEAYFEDAIEVNKGNFEAFHPATAEISIGTGDVYTSHNVKFIPPGGSNLFSAVKEMDRDRHNGQIVHDTFTKPGAFSWSFGNAGTASNQDSLVRIVKWTSPAVAGNVNIHLGVKDDGRYYQDNDSPADVALAQVEVYKLSGVDAKAGNAPIAQRTYFTNPINVLITAKEMMGGKRPNLQFYYKLEDGTEVANTPGQLRSEYVTIPKEGRYRFGVRNVDGPPSETYETEEFLFYSLGFSESQITWNWDPPGLSVDGLNKIQQKGIGVTEAIQEVVEHTSIANDAAGVVSEKQARINAKATQEINAYVQRVASQTLAVQEAKSVSDALLIAANEANFAVDPLKTAYNEAKAIYDATPVSDPNYASVKATKDAALAALDAALDAAAQANIKMLDAALALMEKRKALESYEEALTALQKFKTNFAAISGATKGADYLAAVNKVAGEAAKFLEPLGVLLDIVDIGIAANRIDELQTKLETAKTREAEYKQLLDNLNGGKRELGPKTASFSVTSRPANVDFRLVAPAAIFETFDTQLGPQMNEGMWGWAHLAQIDGGVEKWNKEYRTNSEGSWGPATLTVWGNIGHQSIKFTAGSESMRLASVGLNEDAMLKLAQEALTIEKTQAEIREKKWKIAFDGLSITVGVIAIIFIVFPPSLLIAVAAAAVSVLVSLISLAWNSIWNFFGESELEKTIRKNYPK